MSKYTQHFKLKAVKAYFNQGQNITQTAKQFQLDTRTLRFWIKKYTHHGKTALAVKKRKQSHSWELKFCVVQCILLGKCSVTDAAVYFNVPSSSLVSRWLKVFQKQGITGLLPKQRESPMKKIQYAKMPPAPKTEEERLRLRILELEAEVAVLKKLQALNLQKERKKPK